MESIMEHFSFTVPTRMVYGLDTVKIVGEEAARTLPHPACPVPVGIIKAIEVEAGLDLPRDVEIRLSR